MKRSNFPARKDKRRKEALLRSVDRAGRTDEDQLKLLQRRGHGGCREALKLELRVGEGAA